MKLFESRAICKYLITKYGKGHQLDSSQIASTADIGIYEQAASVEYSYFEPAISGLGYENIFKK